MTKKAEIQSQGRKADEPRPTTRASVGRYHRRMADLPAAKSEARQLDAGSWASGFMGGTRAGILRVIGLFVQQILEGVEGVDDGAIPERDGEGGAPDRASRKENGVIPVKTALNATARLPGRRKVLGDRS